MADFKHRSSHPRKGPQPWNTVRQTTSCRADPMTASVQFSWPPAFNFVAVSVQFFMAADNAPRCRRDQSHSRHCYAGLQPGGGRGRRTPHLHRGSGAAPAAAGKGFDASGGSRFGPRRNLKTYPILAVLLGSGLRVGEVIGLHWADFGPRASTITVERSVVYPDGSTRVVKKPKTRSGVRTVHIPAWVRDALVAYRASLDARTISPESPIFPSRDGDYVRYTSLRRTLASLTENTEFAKKSGASVRPPDEPSARRSQRPAAARQRRVESPIVV